MAKLSVNVNKIATLRNSRGQNRPDVLKTTQDIIRFGAQGITVHPRPDERHIKISDVYEILNLINTLNQQNIPQPGIEFNIEGYPSEEFLNLMDEVRPHQCTLVPDPPEVLTSNAGWKLLEQRDFLITVINRLRKNKIRSSVFIDPKEMTDSEVEALLAIKSDRVELYTEDYAKAFTGEEKESVTNRYAEVAIQLYDLGFGINAGHDLDQSNLSYLLKTVPVIDEVSIGHALICDALYDGLETTVKNYIKIVEG